MSVQLTDAAKRSLAMEFLSQIARSTELSRLFERATGKRIPKSIDISTLEMPDRNNGGDPDVVIAAVKFFRWLADQFGSKASAFNLERISTTQGPVPSDDSDVTVSLVDPIEMKYDKPYLLVDKLDRGNQCLRNACQLFERIAEFDAYGPLPQFVPDNFIENVPCIVREASNGNLFDGLRRGTELVALKFDSQWYPPSEWVRKISMPAKFVLVTEGVDTVEMSYAHLGNGERKIVHKITPEG